MKEKIRHLIEAIVKLFSHVYTYKTYERLTYYNNLLYTYWIKNFSGDVGKNVQIKKPIVIEGGGEKYVSIGDGTIFQSHCHIGAWKQYGQDSYNPIIVIGKNCRIGEFCHISSIHYVHIGDGLLTGRYVYIGDNSHGNLSYEEGSIPPVQRKLQSKGGIEIGENVWLGDKVAVLSGVHIGNNVIVAANAVVTKDIPSNSLVGGVPAKVLKTL